MNSGRALPRKADADNNLTLCADCGQPVRQHLAGRSCGTCPRCCQEPPGNCQNSGGKFQTFTPDLIPGDVWTAVCDAITDARDAHPRVPDDIASAELVDVVFDAIAAAGYVTAPALTTSANASYEAGT